MSCLTIGFIAGFSISPFSLPIIYLTFLFFLFVFNTIKEGRITPFFIVTALFMPLVFFAGIQIFGHTFDTSFDGEDYHQTAVISLARGWNPFVQDTIPLDTKEGVPFVLGYPKLLWNMQAAIYKLFPQHINSATITNLFIEIITFLFVFSLLKSFRMSTVWSITLSFLIVVQPDVVQQFFTFMEDGFSYEVSVIAITSLIAIHKSLHKKIYVVIFLLSLILLAGVKFSNLYIVVMLFAVFAVDLFVVLRIHMRHLIIPILFCTLLGVVLLWVPYGKNALTYSSPFYPSNQKWAQSNLRYENTPKNLRHANKLVLLFYGIYSRAQIGSSSNSYKNVAVLKIPFTTTLSEVFITDNFQSRVAAEGVLFSGIFTAGILLYFFLLWQKKNASEKTVIWVLTIFLVLSFLLALLNPVPQKLHYVPAFYLVPVSVLLCMVMLMHQRNIWFKIFTYVFAILIIANIFLKIVPFALARINDFAAINNEMLVLKNSGKIYQVNAKSFYSNYIRLQEYEVKFEATNVLECKKVSVLPYSSYTTFFCPLADPKQSTNVIN